MAFPKSSTGSISHQVRNILDWGQRRKCLSRDWGNLYITVSPLGCKGLDWTGRNIAMRPGILMHNQTVGFRHKLGESTLAPGEETPGLGPYPRLSPGNPSDGLDPNADFYSLRIHLKLWNVFGCKGQDGINIQSHPEYIHIFSIYSVYSSTSRYAIMLIS